MQWSIVLSILQVFRHSVNTQQREHENMATAAWTIEDLALFCEHCAVIEIMEGEKYCDGCTNEVVEYLAVRFSEQSSVEKGLY